MLGHRLGGCAGVGGRRQAQDDRCARQAAERVAQAHARDVGTDRPSGNRSAPTWTKVEGALRIAAVKRVGGSAAASAPPLGSRPRWLTLSLSAGSGYGGAEKLAYEFAMRLDPARFASYLCTIRAAEPRQRRAEARDVAELASAGVHVLSPGQPGPVLLTPRGDGDVCTRCS